MGLQHESTLWLAVLIEKLGERASFSAIKSPVSQTVIADTFSPVLKDQTQMCDPLDSQERVRASQREDSTDNLLPSGSLLLMKKHMKL